MSNFVLGGCQLGQDVTICNCTGIICKYFPLTCNSKKPIDPRSFIFGISREPPQLEEHKDRERIVAMLKNMNDSHESSIDITREGIVKCFDRVEKIEHLLGDVYKEGNPIKIQHRKELKKPYKNIFDFIGVDKVGIDNIRHVKNALYDLYCWILDNVPDNKYRSDGIDLLEAAAMQLNKSISRGNDNGT